MRTRKQTGFTLVEILIVVVILGILAAIVVPQFTNASNEAIKGALQSQLQTIESQFELYRVRNQGAEPPNFGTAANNNGWDELLDGEYLKEEPFNSYTSSGIIEAGTEANAIADTRASGRGWLFEVDANGNYQFYASGYDETNNLLEHEQPAP